MSSDIWRHIDKTCSVRMADAYDTRTMAYLYAREGCEEKGVEYQPYQRCNAEAFLRDNPAACILLEKDDQIIGQVFYALSAPDIITGDVDVTVWGLYILPEHRSIGRGLKLIYAVLTIASGIGVKRCLCSVTGKRNTSLYRRIGCKDLETILSCEVTI